MGKKSNSFSFYSRSLIVFSLSCLLASFAMAGPKKGEELLDKVVAVVNGKPILYSVVNEKVKVGPLVLVSDFPSDEKASQYERALNDSINYALVMDKVRELDIEVTEDQIEEQIDKLLASQNLDRNGLYQFLEQQGKTYEEYKDDFHKQMLLRRFQGRVISPMIKVTDKDIVTYYLQKSGATSDAIALDIRQILIRVPQGASNEVKEAKRALSKDVYNKIKGGMDFKEAVKIYSDGPNARSKAGLMSGVKLKDLNKALRKSIAPLKVGEFTKPVETPLGYHIFYIEDKQFTNSDEFNAQKRQLEFELRSKELETQTRHWLKEMRQKSKIDIMGKKKAQSGR